MFVVARGFNLDQVMALDLQSFSSLLRSVREVEAATAARDSRTMMIAALQNQKAMQDHVKRFTKVD